MKKTNILIVLAVILAVTFAALFLTSCTKQKPEPITPSKKEVILVKVQAVDNSGKTSDQITVKASN